MRRIAFIALSIVLATGLAVLAVEGFASLALGRSILRRRAAPPARTAMLDEEKIKAAALTEGPFALDPDPYVGIRFKPRFTYEILGSPAHTDDLGLRKRVGPPPQPGAPRIVLLGDSVAFGFGLKDDETIGARLEELLADAMAAGPPRPTVITAACPGWSFRNAQRFLLDHIEDLDPSIVLYITIANDLDDGYGVDESGHRSGTFDPALGATSPPSYLTDAEILRSFLRENMPDAPGIDGFVPVVNLGVTPESKRRFETLVDGLGELQARLRARKARFGVVLIAGTIFERLIARQALAKFPELPLVCGFDHFGAEDGLPDDPHPNARYARAAAWRLARFLIENAWVPGAGAKPLPPEDEKYSGRRFVLDDEAGRSFSQETADRLAAAMVGPRLDLCDGTGWNQIYGGVLPGGAIGADAYFALRCDGARRLRIRVERLARRPGLYPLRAGVVINDVAAGSFEVPEPRSDDLGFEAEVAIPVALQGAVYADVHLRPSNWCVERVHGTSRLVSMRLLRAAFER